MASLVECGSLKNSILNGNLARLANHPMFTELQETLVTECSQYHVPYTLVSDVKTQDQGDGNNATETVDLFVEEATLQAEFRQLAPLRNPQVSQLENFYNTQSVAMVTERSDALTRVNAMCSVNMEQRNYELLCIQNHYEKQQEHLVLRVGKSLKLLKNSLPNTAPSSGGIKNKSRTLSHRAVSVMNEWYARHVDNPYPTEEEKQDMADAGNITIAQVKAWFANKRNRSLNTKPKRQKYSIQNQLSDVCHKFVSQSSGRRKASSTYADIINELAGIVQMGHPAGNPRIPLVNPNQ